VFDSRPLWDAQMQVDVIKLVLDFLKLDAPRLPATMVTRYLKAALELAGQDDMALSLILEGALSALRTESADGDHHEMLTQIVADTLSANSQIAETHPDLVKQAYSMMAAWRRGSS
jgi:hypothetical protein